MLSDWMTTFAKEMEIEGSFMTEVHGVWAIPLEADVQILLTELPQEGFSLTCSLCPYPQENSEELALHLLRANLFYEGTKGAILGLDSEGKQLTLSQHIDYAIDYKEFVEIIEDFINSVDFWLDEVKSFA